jgi:hypothetical protein
MIEELCDGDFRLVCDNCGEECDLPFDAFYDAVEYKKDKDNGWRTIKDKDGEYCDLCPACNTAEIIRELKGVED